MRRCPFDCEMPSVSMTRRLYLLPAVSSQPGPQQFADDDPDLPLFTIARVIGV
jgi:hypothetical protein